jgi:hypothetical protein
MEGSGNNDLVILGLIMAAFYFAGLYKMGFAAGLLWLVATVLLFAFIWPLGVVVVLAVAGYGLLPTFRARRQPNIWQSLKRELSRDPLSGNCRLEDR